jgi:nucleoside-diphosphate-sugar epimerase
MGLHTILGAGGAISNELAPILQADHVPLRLVSRRGLPAQGAETVAADLTDPEATRKAIAGSTVAYLLVGLAYDIQVWREQWPKIMSNVIAACKESGTKLIFFDNVYMYGRVQGAMTEETPFHPVSRKGEVRAQIAKQLLDEMGGGKIEALIARSADFYGPGGDRTGVPNMLVFSNLARGKKAQWLCRLDQPHSFTYVPDAARAVYLLAQRESAFGQTWHLPTAGNPMTGREFIQAAAAAMGRPYGASGLPKWMMSMAGLFDRTVKEAVEMAYQSEMPYRFDSTKFNAAFGFEPTSYQEGIEQTAKWYLANRQAS